MKNEGLTEFLLGGGLESVIISDRDPDITNTHAIVRKCNELMQIPYVQMLILKLKSAVPASSHNDAKNIICLVDLGNVDVNCKIVHCLNNNTGIVKTHFFLVSKNIIQLLIKI